MKIILTFLSLAASCDLNRAGDKHLQSWSFPNTKARASAFTIKDTIMRHNSEVALDHGEQMWNWIVKLREDSFPALISSARHQQIRLVTGSFPA